MDVTNLVLSISIPFLVTILGLVISFLNYRMNVKKSSAEDLEKEREKEARLVRMEADVAYIRQVVDGTHSKLDVLESRIDKVETAVEVLKSQK